MNRFYQATIPSNQNDSDTKNAIYFHHLGTGKAGNPSGCNVSNIHSNMHDNSRNNAYDGDTNKVWIKNNNHANFAVSKISFYHNNSTHLQKTIELFQSEKFVNENIILHTNQVMRIQTTHKQRKCIDSQMHVRLNSNMNQLKRLKPPKNINSVFQNKQNFIQNNNRPQNNSICNQAIQNNNYPQNNTKSNNCHTFKINKCVGVHGQRSGLSNQFVFDPKTHDSKRKNTFEQSFRSYQRSTSRSNSKKSQPFLQQKRIKPQIRIGTINPQTILSKLKSSNDSSSLQCSRQQSSINEHADELNANQTSQKPVRSQILKKQSQFSFQGKLTKNQHQNASSQFSSDRIKPRPIIYNQTALYTIQQVQQSIRSIQLPVGNGLNSDEINKAINDHFQQIKSHMLQQLLIRSKQGSHFDDQSMSLIAEELQHAANNIVQKYYKNNQMKKKSIYTVNVKDQGNKLQFSISESQIQMQSSHKEILHSQQVLKNKNMNGNQRNSSINVGLIQKYDLVQTNWIKNEKSRSTLAPLQADICGSDQKHITQAFLPPQQLYRQNKNLSAFKQKINYNQTFANSNINQAKKINQQIVSIVDQININSLTEPKQINLKAQDKQRYLKYQQQLSKGHSSISSINEESLKETDQNIKISYKKLQNKLKQGEKNKDSIKMQLQNLNKYTFLKSHKFSTKPYAYQQKQLCENDYKVYQKVSSDGDKVYTVKYEVKFLGSPQGQQRKPTQVFRLSPFKFRKKQQVVQQMVRKNFIAKQSQSFVKQEIKKK